MLVLAAVSDLQYQRLRGAVVPPFGLARAATWDMALETIRGRPVEIAVVDPMLGGARGLAGASEECAATLRAGVDSVRGLPLQQQFFQVRSSLSTRRRRLR